MRKGSATNRRRPALGFTLVELVLVLVIVSVLAAIAAPRFAQATARQQLQAAADRVIADLEKAGTRARAASSTAAVTFKPASGLYEVNGTVGKAYTIYLDAPPYNVKIKAARFGGDAVARFNAYGIPVDVGYVTLSNATDSITLMLSANGEVTR